MKFIVALAVVALSVAVQGLSPLPPKKSQLTSADVEALLDPTVSSLPEGQHKLEFTGADGKKQCLVCQPFQGCGCTDVVAIRCELKRLKQKLLRLKRIAAPHKRSHHDRDVEDKPKKVEKPKVAVKPAVLPKVAVKPAVLPKKVVADPKPAVEPKKLLIKPAVVKPEPKPLVLVDPVVVRPAPQVKLAVQPAVVKPAEEKKVTVLA